MRAIPDKVPSGANPGDSRLLQVRCDQHVPAVASARAVSGAARSEPVRVQRRKRTRLSQSRCSDFVSLNFAPRRPSNDSGGFEGDVYKRQDREGAQGSSLAPAHRAGEAIGELVVRHCGLQFHRLTQFVTCKKGLAMNLEHMRPRCSSMNLSRIARRSVSPFSVSTSSTPIRRL